MARSPQPSRCAPLTTRTPTGDSPGSKPSTTRPTCFDSITTSRRLPKISRCLQSLSVSSEIIRSEARRKVMGKLYTELASWWPLFSSPEDYIDEANFFYQVLVAAGVPPAPTLLELGCGGGNNAVHLKEHLTRVTLTDLSPQMLAV